MSITVCLSPTYALNYPESGGRTLDIIRGNDQLLQEHSCYVCATDL